MGKNMTPEQRQRYNQRMREYLKKYRAEHPERVAQWRANAAIRAVERLKQQAEDDAKAAAEGQRNGGDGA